MNFNCLLVFFLFFLLFVTLSFPTDSVFGNEEETGNLQLSTSPSSPLQQMFSHDPVMDNNPPRTVHKKRGKKLSTFSEAPKTAFDGVDKHRFERMNPKEKIDFLRAFDKKFADFLGHSNSSGERVEFVPRFRDETDAEFYARLVETPKRPRPVNCFFSPMNCDQRRWRLRQHHQN